MNVFAFGSFVTAGKKARIAALAGSLLLAKALCPENALAQAAALPPLPQSVSEQARAQLGAFSGAQSSTRLTVAQMRAFADQAQTAMAAEQRKKYAVTITEDVMAGVPVRIVSPSGRVPDAQRVLLNLHGGGFQLDSGSLTENVPIAALTGFRVVAVRYRLAPENPFPAAVNDALAVYRALLKTYRPDHIAVYGTSAGAILGPELVARIIADGLPVPAALGVFSGDADLARRGDSARLFPFSMGGQDLTDVYAAYTGKESLAQPLISPIYGDLKRFPPTLCITSGRDFLLSATTNLCRKLGAEAVSVQTIVFDALPHAFWSYLVAPESDEAFMSMAGYFAQRLERNPDASHESSKPLGDSSTSSHDPSARCTALTQATLPDTTITSARAVPAGPFKALFMLGEAQVPAHCRVEGHISPGPGSDIRFEVWLPLSDWNGRLYGAGNGGFAGAISYSPGLVEAIQRGGAGVSTDTGHAVVSLAAAEDGSWAHGHPERIIDYGYRGVHLSAVIAKALVATFYGEPARRAYFASCSNGGRQALMEAQRYPEDYDGIIAGAPAYDFTGMAANFIWNAQAQRPAAAAIPTSKVPALQAAVLRACGVHDGQQDAILSNPQFCKFDPQVMLCTHEDSDSCLTAAQVVALQKIYAGPRTSTGQGIYPGFPASGAEAGTVAGTGWDGWIFAPVGGETNQTKYSAALLAHFATKLHTDVEHFDFDRDYPVFKSELAPILDATNADLSRFAARGGRLILWHGWADPALPPQHTIDYFDAVRTTMGVTSADRMLRLFMVPGVQHCFGGPGANSFGQFTAPPRPADPNADLSAALERWVEEGVPPEDLVARHASSPLLGALDWREADPHRTKLLCAYPRIAVPKGKDNSALASSYRCVTPARRSAERRGR